MMAGCWVMPYQNLGARHDRLGLQIKDPVLLFQISVFSGCGRICVSSEHVDVRGD